MSEFVRYCTGDLLGNGETVTFPVRFYMQLHETENAVITSFAILGRKLPDRKIHLRRMSRKRFVKLLISEGFSRKAAQAAAYGLRTAFGSYVRGFVALKLQDMDDPSPADCASQYIFVDPTDGGDGDA